MDFKPLVLLFVFTLLLALLLSRCLPPGGPETNIIETIPTAPLSEIPATKLKTPQPDFTPEPIPPVTVAPAIPEPSEIPLPTIPVPSITPGPVVINEVAWMGSGASTFDEWIELYNRSTDFIELAGWRLISDDGMEILLSGNLPPDSYFLIERTNEDTVSDRPANLICSFGAGGLHNTGEDLSLIDSRGKISDSVNGSAGWPGGDNLLRASMERTTAEQMGTADNWQTYRNSQPGYLDAAGQPGWGSPGECNSVATQPA